MYAIPALKLTARQVDELGACWNSVICRLFGYNKWELVSAVLLGLSKLNVKHLIMLHRLNFNRRLLKRCDTFLYDVFLIFLSDNACNDDVLMPVFCHRSYVINNVRLSFKNCQPLTLNTLVLCRTYLIHICPVYILVCACVCSSVRLFC